MYWFYLSIFVWLCSTSFAKVEDFLSEFESRSRNGFLRNFMQYIITPRLHQSAVYNYEYAVQDDYSGVNFGQNEHRDGYSTSGQYRVLLPDGRTQIVTYNTADAYSGNVAEVVYEGTASYAPAPVLKAVPVHAPIHKPTPVFHPAPVHKPAPVYKPAPYHG